MCSAMCITIDFRCVHFGLIILSSLTSNPPTQPPSTCTMFEDLPTYTLYITAIVRMDTVPFLQRRSPVAILDRYEGTGVEIDAPEWIRNGEEYHRFYQPRGVFAELFAKLALSEHNVSKVRFSGFRCITGLKCWTVSVRPCLSHDIMG